MLLIFIKVIYILINAVIGIYDFSFYRLPNILLGMLLVLYVLFAPLYIGYGDILNALLVFGIVLVIGFALYLTNLIGAGDAKYLAVVSLWAGFPGVIQLLLIIALTGAVVALLYLFLKDPIARLSDRAWHWFQKREKQFPAFRYIWIGSGAGFEMGKRENISSRMVPYGLAIAVGAITMMLSSLTI